MADETGDCSSMEQVSICARFVNNCEVREDLFQLQRWMLKQLLMLCSLHFRNGD